MVGSGAQPFKKDDKLRHVMDERPGEIPMRGCWLFLHADETDRDPAIFDGATTIYPGGDHRGSYVLVPIIEAR